MFMCESHPYHGTHVTHVEVSEQLCVSVLTFHCLKQGFTTVYTRLSDCELRRDSVSTSHLPIGHSDNRHEC